MKIVGNDLLDNIINSKINIEMTVGDFLNMYVSIVNVNPVDFKESMEELFPVFNKDEISKLFVDYAKSNEMENIIDQIEFPHEKWYGEV